MKKLILGLCVACMVLFSVPALAWEKPFVWDETGEVEYMMFLSGASPFANTLDNTAVSDQGSNIVRFTATEHGFAVGSHQTLSGTTNYDGIYEILARTVTTFDVRAKFVAETPDATDDILSSYQDNKPYRFVGFELNFSANPSTSGNLVVTKDAGEGSAYDTVLFSVDMSGVTDYVKMFPVPIRCQADDKLVFTYDNADSRTYGIKVIIRRAK